MLGYIALARHLDPERPIYGMQYQYAEEQQLGRPYSEQEYEQWARQYIETIRLIQPHGPYLIGGMCEGALIAFTMTKLLEAAGERVSMLFTLDAWPIENTVRPFMRRLWIWEHELRDAVKKPLADQVRALSKRVGRRVGKTLGTPASSRGTGASTGNGVHHDPDVWKRRLWPGAGFVPVTVDAKIFVFRLRKQPYFRPHDEQCGWGTRTRGGVEVHYVPGDDHFNVLREPEVTHTARIVDDVLKRVDP
jgi:thioesterase domain-containing protein